MYKRQVLQPIGELFLNLLFMTLVPLVFFSVTSAIANMGGGMQRLGTVSYTHLDVYKRQGIYIDI